MFTQTNTRIHRQVFWLLPMYIVCYGNQKLLLTRKKNFQFIFHWLIEWTNKFEIEQKIWPLFFTFFFVYIFLWFWYKISSEIKKNLLLSPSLSHTLFFFRLSPLPSSSSSTITTLSPSPLFFFFFFGCGYCINIKHKPSSSSSNTEWMINIILLVNN